ncbi:hypothetical protein [Modicisalibacter sp. MOD 31.J]|uniref:hypothetical protein n=1 Tax=Modicisalibacter sp. MOD 31.J TaxID=2831897 RepID=UPI001CC9D68D|nr:hypothetical protein [Modicisalibacter sp. MOD 31.J]MBZ9576755.1 hypothetical protein [Modicisalibacter sp. MOD 31.J]
MALSLETTTVLAVTNLRTLATDYAMANDRVTDGWARDVEQRICQLADQIEAEARSNGVLRNEEA